MNADAALNWTGDFGGLDATRPTMSDLCRLQVRFKAVVLEALAASSALAACICGDPVRRGPICVVRYSRFFINSEWAFTSSAIFWSASSMALR